MPTLEWWERREQTCQPCLDHRHFLCEDWVRLYVLKPYKESVPCRCNECKEKGVTA